MKLLENADRPKVLWGASDRSCHPRETLERIRPLMKALGITRLANITGLDDIGVPVYVAVRPGSRGLATSQGKGLDDVAAKCSALMESIETWHAERPATTLRHDSFDALKIEVQVVDPTLLNRRSAADLRPDAPLLWTEGVDLVTGKPCWVPFESVSCNFVRPPAYDPAFVQSTNGLASGNVMLEAVLHGICEVIERDAVTLHLRQPPASRCNRQIRLGSVASANVGELIDRLQRARQLVALWDVTSDIGVPTFSCVISDGPDRQPWRTVGRFMGHGCHLNPEVAILRAITEAIQSRVTYVAGSRDDLGYEEYERVREQRQLHRDLAVADHDGELEVGQRSQNIATSSLAGDLKAVLSRLAQSAIQQVVVVDLSRESVGIPVVKVIIPGLESDIHRSPSYRPGVRARSMS